MHGIVNLVSGYARRRSQILLEQSDVRAELGEVRALSGLRGQANAENLLYYAARLWHRHHQEPEAKQERHAEEEARGIVQLDPAAGYEVGAQLIELARLQQADFDPRVAELPGAAGTLQRSDAVILNVDYPLGLASYQILREVIAEVPEIRGIYAIGKAATLNGDVGDVMIANVVYDEHSDNTYVFENAFTYDDVAPFLERGAVLDNQKAVSVRGTFLQNRAYLEFYYREQYTVVEMEAGPVLSAVYEGTHPTRYPSAEHVHFRRLPFDFGLIHYASDTPYTQARTLGSRSLSFEGIDSTYASTVAVMPRILSLEAERLTGPRRVTL
jgi:hypothetical protein